MAFVQGKDKLVQLTYSFIFMRKDNIWSNVADFESDLNDFFKRKGLEAEAISFIDGSSGNRTLFIRDISKEITLRNDKDIPEQHFSSRKPSSSYTITKRLVKDITKGQ